MGAGSTISPQKAVLFTRGRSNLTLLQNFTSNWISSLQNIFIVIFVIVR